MAEKTGFIATKIVHGQRQKTLHVFTSLSYASQAFAVLGKRDPGARLDWIGELSPAIIAAASQVVEYSPDEAEELLRG